MTAEGEDEGWANRRKNLNLFPIFEDSEFRLITVDLWDREEEFDAEHVDVATTSMGPGLSHIKIRPDQLVVICQAKGRRANFTVMEILYYFRNNIKFAFATDETKHLFDANYIVDEEVAEGQYQFCHDRTNMYLKEARVNDPIWYCIKTTGTTGVPKIVSVPQSAILSNLEDFKQRFKMTSADVILGSTSMLFDPSIIEIFLALMCQGTLVFVEDMLREQPTRLQDIIIKHKVTFAQMTPSLLSMLDESFMKIILGDNSPLRILLIGGEQFPLHLINRYRTPGNKTKIYDVYGVTEVSCWATVEEIEYGRVVPSYIGDPIRNTTITIVKSPEFGLEICISGRNCLVDGKYNVERKHRTGDLVEEVSVIIGGRRTTQYRIVGRKDDLVKIKGVRVSLAGLSEEVKRKAVGVQLASFRCYKSFLILFIVCEENLQDSVRDAVTSLIVQPARIYFLQEPILNNSGKLDFSYFEEMVEQKLDATNIRTAVDSYLEKHGIKKDDTRKAKMSFPDYGFNSLMAVELAFVMRDALAVSDILSSSLSVDAVLRKYVYNSKYESITLDEEPKPRNSVIVVDCYKASYIGIEQPDTIWEHDTRQCIDSNPCVSKPMGMEGEEKKRYILFASHSGMLCCADPETGDMKWTVETGERIEANLVTIGKYVVVCGYYGHLMIYDQETGKLIADERFPGQIRAEPLILVGESIYLICYDGFIRKIELVEQTLDWKPRNSAAKRRWIDLPLYVHKCHPLLLMHRRVFDDLFKPEPKKPKDVLKVVWKQKVSAGSPARPTYCARMILCTTIKGTVEAFDEETGNPLWIFQDNGAIFSRVVDRKNLLYIANVKGEVKRLDLDGDQVGSTLEFGENQALFAGVSFHDDIMYVPSQNGCLGVAWLDPTNDENDYLETRLVKFPHMGFVQRPQFTRMNQRSKRWPSKSLLTLMSTSGQMILVDVTALLVDYIDKSDGIRAIVFPLTKDEIFSRPYLWNDYEISMVLVGGRDDIFRGFEMHDKYYEILFDGEPMDEEENDTYFEQDDDYDKELLDEFDRQKKVVELLKARDLREKEKEAEANSEKKGEVEQSTSTEDTKEDSTESNQEKKKKKKKKKNKNTSKNA